MGNRLIITTEQANKLSNYINESVTKNIVKDVVDYLDEFYEPSFGTHQDKGEYKNTPMVMNKVDEDLITPKNLLRHLILKFNYKPEFLTQIIRDWFDGQLDGEYMLTKNLSIGE
jgi:hypothetical protein